MRRLPRMLVVAMLVVGCGSGSQSTTAPPTRVAPTVDHSLAPSISAPASAPASVEPSSSVQVPTDSPTTGLGPGVVAEVVTDDLRVRTEPDVSDTSVILEPLLQRGTKLFVVDGPVGGSGYPWYEVLLFDGILTPQGAGRDAEQVEGGWVAAAGKDGEAWLDVARYDCPPGPTTFRDLLAVSSEPEMALACFAGDPITVEAILLECGEAAELEELGWCEMDTGGPSFMPSWFYRTFVFVADPDTGLAEDTWFELHADPLGRYPDPLPSGEVVRLTGQFDHPAASACKVNHYFQENEPTVYCRTLFAVTEISPTR